MALSLRATFTSSGEWVSRIFWTATTGTIWNYSRLCKIYSVGQSDGFFGGIYFRGVSPALLYTEPVVLVKDTRTTREHTFRIISNTV